MKRIVLAYSGGLDTTCCLHWLRKKGFEVICFSADLGSEFSPADLRRRALKTGASKIYIKDLKKEFAQDYILPSFRAGAVYQGRYVLSTALARPLIAKYLVEIAKQEKAEYVAHGCSAKGNDQVRIEAGVKLLKPELKIIAPLREWELLSREDEIAYAKKHDLPLGITRKKIYSIDKNIWGLSIEGGALENLSLLPPKNSFILVKPGESAAKRAETVKIEFRKGIPLKLNGKRISFVSLLYRLNAIGARQGVGRTDLIEDRVIGIKTREVYEAPAAWILIKAREELESLVWDRKTRWLRNILAAEYAELVYQGFWFSHLRQSLDSFFSSLAEKLSGSITLKLYKGNILPLARDSVFSLYQRTTATYGKEDKFKREYSRGFIELFTKSYRH